MRTQLVDFLGLASVEVVVSRLLFCYPLVVVCVCCVVVNVKFMECVVCSEKKRGRREGSFFFFFSKFGYLSLFVFRVSYLLLRGAILSYTCSA